MPKLVFDASLIISWCEEISSPIIFNSLLQAGFEPVIPQRVADEVESDNQVAATVFRKSEFRECNSTRFDELTNRFFRLGSGEKAVLALGEEYEDRDIEYFCVLDDRLARNACDRLGLSLVGTIGLCGELITAEEMTLDEADQLIQEMKDNGTRLPENHRELLESLI